MGLPASIPLTVALLAVFLMFAVALQYAITDAFERTRLSMTAFFVFIVATLTLSFWDYALASLYFTAPAALLGILVGHFVGVKKEQEKLMVLGLERYLERFAHIEVSDVEHFKWWGFINFYTIAGALLLINLVGLSNVIFGGERIWAMITCVFGAFLIGSILPYLLHLWRLDATQTNSIAQKSANATSEA